MKNFKIKVFGIILALLLASQLAYAESKVIEVTFASGASLSDIIYLDDFQYIDIYMPQNWTTANLTFLSAPKYGWPMQSLYNDLGTETVVVATNSKTIGLDTTIVNFLGLKYVQVRSGTEGTPVAQGAARTLYFMVKK